MCIYTFIQKVLSLKTDVHFRTETSPQGSKNHITSSEETTPTSIKGDNEYGRETLDGKAAGKDMCTPRIAKGKG